MKKIIYSIVSALILSVTLALIFPTWFLRGDARWTHLNETARVDIHFEGNPKNGRVKVEGSDVRISHPKFLSFNRSQGAAIEIPVSYRTKAYKIKFTPQADEWENNAKVVVRFLGQNFHYDGKRRPAWVVFRNITLNGQPVAGERAVWHDQHFVQKYPLHSSEINTLAFDVHKPLATTDISFVNIVALFFVCLLFNLFFALPKKVADRIVTFISRKDVISALKDGYHHIDPVYRRSFWIIFGVLCFAFGLHAIWFMWGNHDWVYLKYKHSWLEENINVKQGRYMIFSVKALFSNVVFLPIIYDLITFTTLALNAILLCKYWRLGKRVSYIMLCGLVLTVQPFTLSIMYFVHVIPEVFIGVTCILVALLLSESIAVPGGSITKKAVYSLIAIVLINVSLAMYPVLINTIAVTFAGRLLVQSFDWDGSWRKARSCIRLFMISAVNVILGLALYKLIIIFVFPIQSNRYNTETLSWDQVPMRLNALLKQCIHQLYEYNMPFLPQWTLWIFLSFTLILASYIWSTGNFKQKVVRFFLLFSALFATQAAMLIAKTHVICGRVELFGLVFFEALMVAMVFTRFRKLHNLWIIAVMCIIVASVLQDLDCIRVWKLGFDAEKMQWNRVLARLEIQKDFNTSQKYQLVQVGRPISLRPRFYTGQWKKFLGNAVLSIPFDSPFDPFVAHEFYYPEQFIKVRLSSLHKNFPTYPRYVNLLKKLYQAGVLQKAEVWPKPNGLIVWKDIILFVTDGKELDDFRKKFERELGKK